MSQFVFYWIQIAKKTQIAKNWCSRAHPSHASLNEIFLLGGWLISYGLRRIGREHSEFDHRTAVATVASSSYNHPKVKAKLRELHKPARVDCVDASSTL